MLERVIAASKKNLEERVCSKLKNNLVCIAFRKVDRKLFVPKNYAAYAYSDQAIRLNGDSSISQPSLVVQMINLLNLKGNEHVLEIGTASGYSAAILSLCCKTVDTIEIDPDLAKSAKKRLRLLGYENITVHIGDGSLGIPDKSPFDGIVVTAAAKEIPKPLINQLKAGGRIVIPVETKDPASQELILGLKKKNKLITKKITEVRFVPLI